MSVMGILSNSLLNHFTQNTQNQTQQIQQDFQKLGSDLSSGNLSGAQSDFSALQQLVPGIASSAQSSSNISQAFSKLSSDLQSGNLSAAQQDYATLQQDMQSAHGHHHHHQHTGGANASTTMSQIFSQLGQALQSGNLTAAQQAYTTLQQDFAQFATSSGSSAASQAISSGLSVTA
jgi:hypothetical protein